jgi:hypothetical protein
MYTFVIVVIATAANDEAYLLGFGVIRDVPHVVYDMPRCVNLVPTRYLD